MGPRFISTWVTLAVSGIFVFLGNAGASSLYSSADPIVHLNASNFYSTVLNKDHAWLIEFYSSWCGHCINFAPSFVQLAKNVQGWNRVIQVAAINCGDDVNLPICRQYEITGYPTLKFFKPYASATEFGIKYIGNKRPDIIQRNMVDFVMLLTEQKTHPRSWPSFYLPEKASLFEAFNRDGQKEVLFVFDNGTFMPYWLKQAILDLHPNYPPILGVPASRQDLVDSFKITQFPTLVIMAPNGTYQLYDLEPSRESLVNTVASLFRTFQTTTAVPTNVAEDTYDDTIEQSVLSPTEISKRDQVYVHDLEGAIKYAFRHEVSQHKVIEGNQLRALKQFVDVLNDYFPGRANMRAAIRQLKENLQLVSDGIRGEDFNDMWSEVLRGTNQEVEWVGCLGSKPHLRGYPCSLWVTFHTLTVNHALMYPNISLDAPNIVLLAMKEFVKHFFGCDYCAEHFVAMADDPTNPIESVQTPKQEVLWLWAAHNKVNQRIAKSLSEDPTAPKIQFPSLKNCPSCRSDEVYDEEAVYRYMLDLYRPEAISLERREFISAKVNSGGARPLPFELSILSAILEMLLSYFQLHVLY